MSDNIKKLEYLERRCAINEAVLGDIWKLLGMHFPALQPQLWDLSNAWDGAINKLNEDTRLENVHAYLLRSEGDA